MINIDGIVKDDHECFKLNRGASKDTSTTFLPPALTFFRKSCSLNAFPEFKYPRDIDSHFLEVLQSKFLLEKGTDFMALGTRMLDQVKLCANCAVAALCSEFKRGLRRSYKDESSDEAIQDGLSHSLRLLHGPSRAFRYTLRRLRFLSPPSHDKSGVLEQRDLGWLHLPALGVH